MNKCICKVLLTRWAFDLRPISEINTDDNAVQVNTCDCHNVGIHFGIGKDTTSAMGVNVGSGGCALHGFRFVDNQLDVGAIPRSKLLIGNIDLLQILIKEVLFFILLCFDLSFDLLSFFNDDFIGELQIFNLLIQWKFQ